MRYRRAAERRDPPAPDRRGARPRRGDGRDRDDSRGRRCLDARRVHRAAPGCSRRPVDALEQRLASDKAALLRLACTCRRDDLDGVVRAVRQFVPRMPGGSKGSVVAPPRNGWIGVYDELTDRNPEMLRRLAREISDRMGAVVLQLGVEEGQVVRFVLLERGRVMDEYLSVPEYYGEVPPGDVISLAANPTVVARLTGADPGEVRRVITHREEPGRAPARRASWRRQWARCSESRAETTDTSGPGRSPARSTSRASERPPSSARLPARRAHVGGTDPGARAGRLRGDRAEPAGNANLTRASRAGRRAILELLPGDFVPVGHLDGRLPRLRALAPGAEADPGARPRRHAGKRRRRSRPGGTRRDDPPPP